VGSVACDREIEVLDALQSPRWPAGADDELRTHVASCTDCTELVHLSVALLRDHRALMQEAHVPSSAIVWWRAQVRSRREAAEQVTQPISVIQGLAAACAAGLLVAAAGSYSPAFRRALSWVVSSVASLGGADSQPHALEPFSIGIQAAIALAIIVAPLALYFTLHEEK
jgi:hypothetical protein